MSYTVSAPTAQAVIASISTPVRAVVRASPVSVISPAAASMAIARSTKDSGSG